MRPPLIYIFLTLILSACSWTNKADERLDCLYIQRIENSNYVLYEFSYTGAFVTSSVFSGITILDSNEMFTKSKIDRLPCSYFITKPTIGNLKMLDIEYGQNPRTEKDTLLTSNGQYTKTFNGVQFDITKYKDTYGSATMNTGLMRYEFDSLKETKDSMTFYNVTKKFGGRIFPSTASFLKGNIKVVDSKDNRILYVQIEQAIIERGNIYKPTSPLELVPNQPIVGSATYEFYPRTTINSKTLTDFGIWKRVK
jgi:hypothetical protein